MKLFTNFNHVKLLIWRNSKFKCQSHSFKILKKKGHTKNSCDDLEAHELIVLEKFDEGEGEHGQKVRLPEDGRPVGQRREGSVRETYPIIKTKAHETSNNKRIQLFFQF